MLFKRRERHADICILCVSPDVLDLPGVVITDMNAAAEGLYVSFKAAPAGLQIVDRASTFAEYWTDPDQIQYYRKKSAKCAEVLVPDHVAPQYIQGCYVSCAGSRDRVLAISPAIKVVVDAHLFFL